MGYRRSHFTRLRDSDWILTTGSEFRTRELDFSDGTKAPVE